MREYKANCLWKTFRFSGDNNQGRFSTVYGRHKPRVATRQGHICIEFKFFCFDLYKKGFLSAIH